MSNEKSNEEKQLLEKNSDGDNEQLNDELNLCTNLIDENRIGYKRRLESNQTKLSKKYKDEVNLNEPSTSDEKNDLSDASSSPSVNISNEIGNVSDALDREDNSMESEDEPEESSNILSDLSVNMQLFFRNIIHFSKCSLHPGQLTCSPMKDKPLGCKTIFISGLPQQITEEIIKEVFGRCGPFKFIGIEKDLCCISFVNESSAEQAVCFDGYLIKIENRAEALYNGILNIDYASREFDLNRTQHPEDSEDCAGFSIETLIEKLQNENTFLEAFYELEEWLKNEKKSKSRINLYSVMQCVYFHVFTIVLNKINIPTDNAIALGEYLKKSCKLFIDIENLFKLSREQQNNIYFTKLQKRHVKTWENHCNDWKIQFLTELAEISFENPQNQLDEDYDLSDEDDQNDPPFMPVPPLPANDHVASVIREKLEDEDTFIPAANALLTCLEDEDYTYIKIESCYTLMLCIHNHVIKLRNKYEDLIKDLYFVTLKCFKKIFYSLTKVKKIYAALSLKQDVYFTSSERENFSLWKTYAEELRVDVQDMMSEKTEINNRELAEFFAEENERIRQIRETNRALIDECIEARQRSADMRQERQRRLQSWDNQVAAMQRDILEHQRAISHLRHIFDMNELKKAELQSFIKQKLEEKSKKDDKSE